jgi:DNA-binding response OmpR family regulator
MPAKGSPVARILIAEDDPRIAASIEKALRRRGFTTFVADNGEMAQSLSLTDEFDLLILDMGLPQREGFHVLQELRWRGRTLPVLVLTGRSDRDVVACLDAGADDYMRKPFDVDELIVRIQTRLRSGPRAAVAGAVTAGGVRLDVRMRRATVGERTVDLTAREFAVLETFVRHAGQIMSRQQLLSHGWADSVEPSSNVVEVTINSLRAKLGPDVVETVRGAGYRLPTR